MVEPLWLLPLRCVARTRDNLYLASPQGGDADACEIREAYQLVFFAMHDCQWLLEIGNDLNFVRIATFSNAYPQRLPGPPVCPLYIVMKEWGDLAAGLEECDGYFLHLCSAQIACEHQTHCRVREEGLSSQGLASRWHAEKHEASGVLQLPACLQKDMATQRPADKHSPVKGKGLGKGSYYFGVAGQGVGGSRVLRSLRPAMPRKIQGNKVVSFPKWASKLSCKGEAGHRVAVDEKDRHPLPSTFVIGYSLAIYLYLVMLHQSMFLR